MIVLGGEWRCQSRLRIAAYTSVFFPHTHLPGPGVFLGDPSHALCMHLPNAGYTQPSVTHCLARGRYYLLQEVRKQ